MLDWPGIHRRCICNLLLFQYQIRIWWQSGLSNKRKVGGSNPVRPGSSLTVTETYRAAISDHNIVGMNKCYTNILASGSLMFSCVWLTRCIASLLNTEITLAQVVHHSTSHESCQPKSKVERNSTVGAFILTPPQRVSISGSSSKEGNKNYISHFSIR